MGLSTYGERFDAMHRESYTVQRKKQRAQSQIGLRSLLPKYAEEEALLKNFETEKDRALVFARSSLGAARRSPQPTTKWSFVFKSTRNDATRALHAAVPLQLKSALQIAQPWPHLCAAKVDLCAADPEPSHRLRDSESLQDRQSHPPPAAAALPGANQDAHLVELHELTSSSPRQEPPVWKKRYEGSSSIRDKRLKDLNAQIGLERSVLEALRHTRTLFPSRIRVTSEDKEIKTSVAFTPLSEEEEGEVHQALHGANRHEVLAKHERSNIDLTRAAMQCLKPGVWLNDEVINLYLELLKERELREPKIFMKCHFFNTFFFNKLYKDARSYDFKAVRRWTTQKKLGYNLLECDKIFVPIHKDIHWCLAVINVREKKLQYLDSLKGQDGNALHVLARYLKDEVKDKLNQNLDASTWDLDCPKDIPEQLNGCDCGMFMIKYADFYSRGDHLKFTQEHMEYFRKRTVLELLQLKAR